MSSLAITLTLAFAVVVLALAMLGISRILTGKSSLRPGACGRDPNKKRDDDCGKDADCQLCNKDDKKK